MLPNSTPAVASVFTKRKDDVHDVLNMIIVLVESKIKHEIFNKKIDFLTIFKKEISRKMIVSLLPI